MVSLLGNPYLDKQEEHKLENPVDPESTSKKGAGVGLANVRHRLENVFGAEARLRSGRSGETYRAEVVMPVPEDGVETKGEADG